MQQSRGEMSWEYLGSLYYGVDNWCEFCNRGSEVYHIIYLEASKNDNHFGEMHICDDCLEVMKKIPDKCIDLVVTDPPYNLNYTGRGEIANSFAGDNMDNEEWFLWMEEIFTQCYRLLKDGSAIYVWIDWRNYPTICKALRLFEIKNCIVWHKNNFGMGQHYRYQHEFCVYAVKGKHELNFAKRNVSDIWMFRKDDVNSYKHPTQKPIGAMRLPIEYSGKELTLDPFLGSGTTALASRELNKDFIGIEINPEYCKIAENRLANTQGSLF